MKEARLPFNEAKAAQAAAYLLKLRGGSMSYMKLIKLLYLADREALMRWGRPVTTDRYVSMNNGPVLSNTFDRITSGPEPDRPSPWQDLISGPSNYEVALRSSEPPDDELSMAEEVLLDEIFNKYGSMSRWKLVDVAHGLSEWRNPEGSAIPITYREILEAGGRSTEEIDEIESELASAGAMARLSS